MSEPRAPSSGESDSAALDDLVAHVPLPRWTAPVFLACVLVLVPWIVWLALSLPRRHTDKNYDVTWVGFDVGLLSALACVMWFAQRRSTHVELAAAAAGTMLVVDAWFDITTASSAVARTQAIGAAVLFELPVAIVCWWVARNAEAVRRRRNASLLERVRADPRRPR